MDCHHVIATLLAHERDLRHLGVRHVALFGSAARDEAKADSDIALLIEIDPDAPVGLFEYIGFTKYLADMFPTQVDVADRKTLKAHVRPSAKRHAIYAF